VLHLERERLPGRPVLAGYLEGATIERVSRIDDGNRLQWLLAVRAARGIKKIPRRT
jgi:hypothetical protein